MRSFATSKQLFRLERLSQTHLVLANRLGRHFREKIGRPGKQIVPPSLRLELREDPRANGILLRFRESSQFSQRLLKYFTHTEILTPTAAALLPAFVALTQPFISGEHPVSSGR